MNKMVGIASLLILVVSLPDVSWPHSHIGIQELQHERALMLAERNDFIGPVLRDEGLSQRAGQTPWNGFSLAHTDTHHSLASDRHRSGAHRNFYAPDGMALMFSWPFESLSMFQTNTQITPGAGTLNYDNGSADLNSR
ncbi:MAG: hypothetical protein U0236_10255 [Nitrospira sp.]